MVEAPALGCETKDLPEHQYLPRAMLKVWWEQILQQYTQLEPCRFFFLLRSDGSSSWQRQQQPFVSLSTCQVDMRAAHLWPCPHDVLWRISVACPRKIWTAEPVGYVSLTRPFPSRIKGLARETKMPTCCWGVYKTPILCGETTTSVTLAEALHHSFALAFYNGNLLWDGAGCGGQSTRCSFKTAPSWFYK